MIDAVMLRADAIQADAIQTDDIRAEDDATASEDDPSRPVATDNATDQIWYKRLELRNYLLLPTKLGHFLEIKLGCIPISDVAYVTQMKWTDWLLLLKRSGVEGTSLC